jgi:hypothetical protein
MKNQTVLQNYTVYVYVFCIAALVAIFLYKDKDNHLL